MILRTSFTLGAVLALTAVSGCATWNNVVAVYDNSRIVQDAKTREALHTDYPESAIFLYGNLTTKKEGKDRTPTETRYSGSAIPGSDEAIPEEASDFVDFDGSNQKGRSESRNPLEP